MAYKPKPNFYGSTFYLHDRVLIIKTKKAGIITGFDYSTKVPRHIVTFNYGTSEIYTKSYADDEITLLKRDDRIIESILRYEEMSVQGR